MPPSPARRRADRSSSPPPGAAIVSNPHEGIEQWFEPEREILVVESAEQALATYHRLLDDPAEAEAMGARARERVLDEHTYAHRARQLFRLLELPTGSDMSLGRIVAIVPAYREEAARGRCGRRRSRRTTRRSTSSSSMTARPTAPPRLPRRAGAAVVRLPSTSGSERRCRPGSATPSSEGTTPPSGSTATGSTTPLS